MRKDIKELIVCTAIGIFSFFILAYYKMIGPSLNCYGDCNPNPISKFNTTGCYCINMTGSNKVYATISKHWPWSKIDDWKQQTERS
jgi:hypothetical protein